MKIEKGDCVANRYGKNEIVSEVRDNTIHCTSGAWYHITKVRRQDTRDVVLQIRRHGSIAGWRV